MAKTFVFDVFVPEFEVNPTRKSVFYNDPSAFSANIQFNGKALAITTSRMKVEDFKPNSGMELSTPSKKIRQSLEECGFPVQLAYGGKVIGIGLIGVPQEQIDKIEDNMSDWIFTGSCNVELEGKLVGKVGIQCRLFIKCDEPKKYVYILQICRSMIICFFFFLILHSDDPKTCKNVDEVVPKDDIMFIMADSQRNANPCDACLDVLPPEEGDPILQMDLDRYRSFQEALKTVDIFKHTPAANAACCEIKVNIIDTYSSSF